MRRNRLEGSLRGPAVDPVVYWLSRAVLQPSFLLLFRMKRYGRRHIPARGPVILASNHRSFLDPFLIGCLARRPVYFMAKRELFAHPLVAWWLSALGAFPVERGIGDGAAMTTAQRLLERGECVVIFPEGTRVRPGPLGRPKRGVGRLALVTGAAVVPVAIIGTDAVRRGWRIRPRPVALRCGAPLPVPLVERPAGELAAAVTDRIWPCVQLQWAWLGGEAPAGAPAVNRPRAAAAA